MKFGLFFIFFWCSIFVSNAQNPENQVAVEKGVLGKNPLLSDTTINNDSTIIVSDTIKSNIDSLKSTPPPKGDIETTINYSARDSINFSVDLKIVKLYGDAKIKYGVIELEADEIEIDYTKHQLTAHGRKDSMNQKLGYPIFKNGAETYETKDIIYNFKTGRARISEVVTQQGDGFLHGEIVYKNEKNELFSIENRYTTCNLEKPHYHIRTRRSKAIPDDKVVAGPFNLYINDVPTILGFPFGMFPAKNEASSGIIVPSYGEERRRGFYLRGGGYFFDISEYIKAELKGDIYSKGGHALTLNSSYNKRYAYRGNLNFGYTKTLSAQDIENRNTVNDFRLTWSHSPQSKGSSRFSASVNAATSTYNQNNFLGINTDPNNTNFDNLTQKLSSNISYSKSFGSLVTLGVSMRHNQDVRSKKVDLLLPSVSLNVANIYPFKGKNSSSNSWRDKINFRYSLAGTNDLTNNLGRIGSDASTDSIAPFDFDNFSTFLKNSRKGFKHNIPLSTSFKMLKHFTMSPSLNYDELWYFEKLEYDIDPDNPTRAIVTDTLPGFNRVHTYSFSTSLNTRLYGTYFFKKGRVQAIRHVINPSLSFTYRPDFSKEKFGYYDYDEVTDENNEVTEVLVNSRYQGFAYGGPSRGENGSIGLSLSNTLEMKVKTKSDSTDQTKKIPILKNFGVSTSYNLVADSFNLTPLSIRATTAAFDNKLNINFNGTIDPYLYILDSTGINTQGEAIYYQRRVKEFTWNNGEGLGQLSRATLALSTNLSPKARKKEADTQDKIQNSNLSDADKGFLLDNPDAYVDFNIPWSLRISYNLSYNKKGYTPSELKHSLRFSGDFALTEKWKVTYNSGYDFEQKDFTITTLGISRDLHCWEMTVSWTPFGDYTSYNFVIRVKSSLLQDLKLNRNRSFFDR